MVVVRSFPVRLGVDINVGEDKPVQLSMYQDPSHEVWDCTDTGFYPKLSDREKREKCIDILANGEKYPINYVGGGVDIWTVNQNPEGEYTITRLNGKTVDLGLGSD